MAVQTRLFFFFLKLVSDPDFALEEFQSLGVLGVNTKQLSVATFAAVSGGARSVHLGAGLSDGRRECSFQNCFSGVSILDCFSFPIAHTSFPCVSPHFFPVSDSTLSRIHLDPCNLSFSPGRVWRLYKNQAISQRETFTGKDFMLAASTSDTCPHPLTHSEGHLPCCKPKTTESQVMGREQHLPWSPGFTL